MSTSMASYFVNFWMSSWPSQSCSSPTDFSITIFSCTVWRWNKIQRIENVLMLNTWGFPVLQTTRGGAEDNEKSHVRRVSQDRLELDWEFSDVKTPLFAASCNYWRWGSAGRQENINAICILALNMINDKVFLIFWWWLYFLLATGTTRLVFRIFQIRSVQK